MLVPSVALRAALCLAALTQTCDSLPNSKVAPCQGEYFRCESGVCVDVHLICDGSEDCLDGSDETKNLCKPLNISCPPTAFQCDYGACIRNNKKCDGITDCADGSDETPTKCSFEETTTKVVRGESSSQCKDDEIICASGQCIDEFSACDGKEDCTDGSDETKSQCSIMTCPPTAFSCSYGGCVEVSAQCNGYKDCADNSDEDPNLCRTTTVGPTTRTTTVGPTTRTTTVGPTTRTTTVGPTTRTTTTVLPPVGCILPDQPEYSNYISPCPSNNISSACRNIPGTYVDEHWELLIHCNNGYYFKETENDFSTFCTNGKWSPDIPVCRKMCTPLISLSVHVKCVYESNAVDCNKPMRAGTQASGQCKPLYTKTKSLLSMDIICQENGQWNNTLFFCDPVCGKRNVYESGKLLYKHGLLAQHGDFPWHVGIYIKNSTDQWQLTCGGSLISSHTVLTAARCLHSKKTSNRLHPREIKVGLGKYHMEWTHSEVNAVKADVREIQIPLQYSEHETSLAHDIALVDLTHSLQINMYTMPICIDWYREYSLTTGMNGMLAGWGGNDKLLYAEMPYLNHDECASELPAAIQHYIPLHKFCARSNKDNNAVLREKGGGFAFVHNNLSYVYGVVSTTIRTSTTPSGVVIFTSISDTKLLSWLLSVKTNFDKEHLEK